MSRPVGAWVLLPILGAPLAHAPVLRWDLFGALNRPLDAGVRVRGRRLFGENKTWRGAIAMSAGTMAAAAALDRAPWFRARLPEELNAAGPLRYGAALSVAVVAGELPNSLVKRQLGIEPGGRRWTPAGTALVVFDQADFVPLAWLALRPLWHMPARDAATAFGLVVAIHMGLNVVGYAIGARTTPI